MLFTVYCLLGTGEICNRGGCCVLIKGLGDMAQTGLFWPWPMFDPQLTRHSPWQPMDTSKGPKWCTHHEMVAPSTHGWLRLRHFDHSSTSCTIYYAAVHNGPSSTPLDHFTIPVNHTHQQCTTYCDNTILWWKESHTFTRMITSQSDQLPQHSHHTPWTKTSCTMTETT